MSGLRYPVLLRIAEVAECLACHPITVRRLIKRGLLRPVYVGRALRISEDEILRYINKRGESQLEDVPDTLQ